MTRRIFGPTRQTMSTFYRLPALPKLLCVPEPRHQKPQRPERKGVLSVERLAHMRYEHEFDGASVTSLAQKYGIAVKRAVPLLDYTNFRHVRPSPPPGHSGHSANAAPVLSKDERNKAIYAAFNGRNHSALARQYALSEGGIRHILKETREVLQRRTKPAAGAAA